MQISSKYEVADFCCQIQLNFELESSDDKSGLAVMEQHHVFIIKSKQHIKNFTAKETIEATL